MSPRARVICVVAAAAATAAGVSVAAALLPGREGEGVPHRADAVTSARRSGAPPLLLDLGLRRDPEATALRRASRLYARGRRADAARAFGRYTSVEARIGSALARWPDGSVARLRRLADAHPRSAAVRMNLGLALFWAGRRDEAVEAWRAARRLEPDSIFAIRADDLLHPNAVRGLPTFVPSFAPLAAVTRLPADRELAALRRAARTGGYRERLLLGVAYQQIGRPRSARREFDTAARLAPANVEAQVAAAVGRFDKAHPERAFARLGPLARRFPRAAVVRFHLGLLLLWLGELEDAERQLELARRYGGTSPHGREARRFLDTLERLRPG